MPEHYPVGVSDAVVIDVKADLLPTPNGSSWVRLLVRPQEATELLESLKDHHDGR